MNDTAETPPRPPLGRLVGWLRDAWLMVGIALAVLICVEAASALGSRLRSREPEPIPDAYSPADHPWLLEFREDSATALQWRSYVYWRRAPRTGRYVNVDAEGLRRTVHVGAGDPGTRQIWMFGGSTMWGTGVRDEFTIPSALARALAERGQPARIVNFGETGYVSTQSLLALLLRLRQGSAPDLVIFYDGVNDSFAAYQQGRAGLPQNEANRALEFNLSSEDNLAGRMALLAADLPRQLRSARFLQRLLRRAGGRERPPAAGAELAQDVVRSYAANLELIEALATRYGFLPLFFWQPSIVEKPQRTAFEAEQLPEPALAQFIQLATERVRESGLAARHRFYDLSRSLSEVREPLFIDWCHLGERGNEKIAAAMLPHVLQTLAQLPSAESAVGGAGAGAR